MRTNTIKTARSISIILLLLGFSSGVQAAGSTTLAKCLNKVATECAGYTGHEWLDCVETGEELCNNQNAARPDPGARKPVNGATGKVQSRIQKSRSGSLLTPQLRIKF